jgi:hypothetical protein
MIRGYNGHGYNNFMAIALLGTENA